MAVRMAVSHTEYNYKHTIQHTSNLLFSAEVHCIDNPQILRAVKRTNPGSAHTHFMKSSPTLYEESAESPRRICGSSVTNSSD